MSHEHDKPCQECGNWIDEDAEQCHICGADQKDNGEENEQQTDAHQQNQLVLWQTGMHPAFNRRK